MVEAVIFDLDGTLVDTEVLWMRAIDALAAQLGRTPDPAVHALVAGISTAATAAVLRRHYALPLDEAWLNEALVSAVARLYTTSLRPRPGAAEVVPALARRFPLAIASGSPLELIEAAVDNCGWRAHFAALRSTEPHGPGKPAPDVYLTAAAALGVGPQRCLAVEDTPTGVAAAKAAGMVCYAVPSREYFSAADVEAAGADAVLDSLAELLGRIHVA
jgi:HAD superfamily hydrolase (TIGR01509 family)